MRALLSMLLLTVAAVPAGAQGDARLGRLDAASRAALAALVDSTAAVGLPTEPLIQRALEGASKGASSDRIVAAVRRLAADLATARRTLGRDATAAELEAGAAALYVGARPRDLTTLRERRPGRSLVVPLGVLTDLAARGVPADTATAAVLALAATAADEQYLVYRRNVERDIALGAPPAAAASLRADAAAREAARRP